MTKARQAIVRDAAPARPRRLPHGERRAQLLQAARAMILREGIGALTMEGLAEAAGVTKPIVYRHFDNSEDVTVAVLSEYAQASVDFIIPRITGAPDLDTFFARVVDALFDFIERNGALSRSITNGFSSSARIDACFLEMQDRAWRIYSHLLRDEGIAENRARLAGYALLEMINSTILEFAGRCDPEDRAILKGMVSATIRSLIGGKGGPPRVPDHLVGGNGLALDEPASAIRER